MTAREADRRYGAIDKRAAVGFATILLHHWLGHDLRPYADLWIQHRELWFSVHGERGGVDRPGAGSIKTCRIS